MRATINNLLKLNLDAAKGYEFVAENIKNENFKNFLLTYSRQREKQALELRVVMLASGFDVNIETSLLGDIHKMVMKFRENISPIHDQALIEECIRGENEAVSQYERALKSNLFDHELQKLSLSHLNRIRAALGTLKELHMVI